jgi:hypothetical protein
MPNVSYIRPEVAAMSARWTLIRDCLSGQEAVKKAGTRHLPMPNPTDTSEENRARYAQYVERALFYNVTQRTHGGLVGQVFQKLPVLVLPTMLEPIRADADGSGVDLSQQAKKAVGYNLAFGRAGLLADFPARKETTSRADLVKGTVKPRIVLYDPWSVINWREETIGSVKKLTKVVLSETYTEDDDGFELSTGEQYRVLSLITRAEMLAEIAGNEAPDLDDYATEADRIYRVGLWRKTDEKGEWVEAEIFYPTNSAGVNLDAIPFSFIGSTNNDTLVDLPPMYDLAVVNIAHYRNSADQEEASFIVGQATPVIVGVTEHWVDKVLKGKITLGSRAAIPLPVGASASLLQASATTMPGEGMKDKERQMVALGARLAENRQVARTLGEAKIELSTEMSVLDACASNVANAYNVVLVFCMAFLGVTGEASIELQADYSLGSLSPQERQQLMAEWQAQGISFTEYRTALKKAGVAFQEDQDAKDEIAASPNFSTPSLVDNNTETKADLVNG